MDEDRQKKYSQSDAYKQAQKRYRDKNKEKAREKSRAYYAANKEKITKRARESYRAKKNKKDDSQKICESNTNQQAKFTPPDLTADDLLMRYD